MTETYLHLFLKVLISLLFFFLFLKKRERKLNRIMLQKIFLCKKLEDINLVVLNISGSNSSFQSFWIYIDNSKIWICTSLGLKFIL